MKKKKRPLDNNIKNTQNSEHYASYIKEREEIHNKRDGMYAKQGKQNMSIPTSPTRETVQNADDLE